MRNSEICLVCRIVDSYPPLSSSYCPTVFTFSLCAYHITMPLRFFDGDVQVLEAMRAAPRVSLGALAGSGRGEWDLDDLDGTGILSLPARRSQVMSSVGWSEAGACGFDVHILLFLVLLCCVVQMTLRRTRRLCQQSVHRQHRHSKRRWKHLKRMCRSMHRIPVCRESIFACACFV